MLFRLALAIYLLIIAYFAFKPFKPIPGDLYPCVASPVNGIICAGAALEDGAGGDLLRKRLMKTGRISLEILLKTDSLCQGGAARIVSLSRDAMNRNFTLGQEGDGLCFRLRTTETDDNGVYPSLLAQNVFNADQMQHLVVTYDGERVRLYIDGKLHPKTIDLHGDFDNWGRDHLLTIFDEAPGGRSWKGAIERFSIYGRALGAEEVALAYRGVSLPGAVYIFYDGRREGVRLLNYRNLFVFTDPGSNPMDSFLNIIAFMPLASLIFLSLSDHLRRRRVLSIFLIPALSGLAMTGFIEFVQRGIAGRVPCLIDLMNNFLGTLLGCLLLRLVLQWFTDCFFNKGESA